MSESTQTVAFHSFRGTAGRSTALANVAHALAERGETVGCIDLDLASPVLHTIFPHIGKKHANSKQIHDHLKGYEGDIEDYIIDVGDAFDRNDAAELDGELHLISGKVTSPGKENPYEMMQTVLELRKEFEDEKNLDYLLLNTRSGLSKDMFPVFDQSDKFLIFHEWTHTDKQGTGELARWLDDIGPDLDNIMTVASNVPQSVDESDIEAWVNLNLYRVSDYHIVNSSEILKEGEAVVALKNEDAPVVEQYRSLAESLVNMDSGTDEEGSDSEDEGGEKSDTGEEVAVDNFEKRSHEFTKELRKAREKVNGEYEEEWKNVTDLLGKSKVSLSQSLGRQDEAPRDIWERELKHINTDQFFDYLSEVYFCPDIETYEDQHTLHEDNCIFLLPFQREVYEEVEDWEAEDFSDVDARKSYIEQKVEELQENPWQNPEGENGPKEVARDFDDRYVEQMA